MLNGVLSLDKNEQVWDPTAQEVVTYAEFQERELARNRDLAGEEIYIAEYPNSAAVVGSAAFDSQNLLNLFNNPSQYRDLNEIRYSIDVIERTRINAQTTLRYPKKSTVRTVLESIGGIFTRVFGLRR